MGAPVGNQNAAKSRVFEQALLRAIAQDDGKRLRGAAEKLLDLAEQGAPWAVQYLADRLDGRPKQATEVTGEDGGPVKHSIAVEFVNPVPRET